MKKLVLVFLVFSFSIMGCSTAPKDQNAEHKQLLSAIRSQDLSAVKSLVATGNIDLDPPTRPNQINKALAYASIYGNLEIVKYLLAQGVDIDGRISYGGTALLRASEMENNDIAEFLIRSGADVNKANSFGISAMVGYAITCNTNLIDLALEYGGDIDLAHKMTVSTGYGELAYNPIQWAVLKGELECVKHLLSKGAKTNVISRDNETLLEMAIKYGNTEIIGLMESTL
ncbi:ankyrin repeat domain-containing protein [Teredinibacter franksiae]|uniref:ankyrin repeat domain-containing protein n=1 Tax=Teredinibacter franksiae TaxID=2761453 RepID=UPI001624B43E|nr:ankyrin repeat domain-containing protein [Teredinibacter franksiae]